MFEPPKILNDILAWVVDYREKENLTGDFTEVFNAIVNESGYPKAIGWYILQILKLIPVAIIESIIWSLAMFNNYFKIAVRNLKTHKMFSFINVFGLAIGIATFMLLSFWVQRELSYDQFHENASRIYRIERELFRDNLYSRWPICGARYKQALIDDYPEIENAVRFWGKTYSITDKNNFVHQQHLYAADNSVFEIFDYGLEIGDEKTALVEPYSIVLTSEDAEKYFGTQDVVGKSLLFEYYGEPVNFKITGVLKELPENSHIQFDMLMSISTLPEEVFGSWRSNYLYTYVLVKEGTDRTALEDKLKMFVEKRLEAHYGDLTPNGENIHKVLKMHLFPLTEIHLNPSINFEWGQGGSITTVYVFSSIAILILIIAGINFMNLSTARANNRAKEVGIRKTVGALNIHLKMQFIQESIFLAVIALLISILLVFALVHIYNAVFNENFSAIQFLSFSNLSGLFVVTLLVGLFSGLYPAFYLTRFEPISVLKGGIFKGNTKSSFRKILVIFQFTISIVIIVGMLIVYMQMHYIQNKGLGFNRENLVVVPVRSSNVRNGFEAFRNQLLSFGKIKSVAASADLPGDPQYGNNSVYNREVSDESINMIVMYCGYEYVDTYNMEIVVGRNFSRDIASDTAGTLILNEAAVKRIGWQPDEAVGKNLYNGGTDVPTKVVGVVKDFNFKSLREEIEPMMLVLLPHYFTSISIRILPGNLTTTLDFIKRKWEEMFSEELYSKSFLTDRLEQLYENEKKTQSILFVFSILSILIACLGLFGLAAFTAEDKTKEIGIRKTLGASISRIILLLSKEFLMWVIIANLIAWPISYFLMNNWLDNFAYHIYLGWMPFLSSAIISLIIALFTISFHVLKSAGRNPVDTLRYE
ncbi:ABC transporter permease [Bacteroidota bacterium]